MAELPTVVSPTREAIFAAYEADARTEFRAHLIPCAPRRLADRQVL